MQKKRKLSQNMASLTAYISFNGHDRQPPDKIFRFVRSSETAPWRLQVTDVASPEIVIEERTK